MIHVEDLTVRAGSFQLNNVQLRVGAGEYGVLMGKTGSGKTTLLECICGLRPVDSGRIVLGGQDVTAVRPADRGIGYVPQDGVLFARMTVRRHLGFPLLVRGWSKDRIAARTNELAELLTIGHLLERRPAKLSGGEAQRVALGRALSFQPQVLLLDEPLSALDDQTRREMYELLKCVQQETNVTALHITHSQQEADRLGDRLFVLQGGKIARTGEPETTGTDLEAPVTSQAN